MSCARGSLNQRRRGRCRPRCRHPAGSAEGAGGRILQFKTGVELINVTASVSDASGRFVHGPRQRTTSSSTRTASARKITHFSSERIAGQPRASCSTPAAAWPARRSRRPRPRSNRFLFDLLGSAGRDLPLRVRRRSATSAGLDDRSAGAVARDQPDSRRRRARRCTTRSPKRSRSRPAAAIRRRPSC